MIAAFCHIKQKKGQFCRKQNCKSIFSNVLVTVKEGLTASIFSLPFTCDTELDEVFEKLKGKEKAYISHACQPTIVLQTVITYLLNNRLITGKKKFVCNNTYRSALAFLLSSSTESVLGYGANLASRAFLFASSSLTEDGTGSPNLRNNKKD